MPRHYKAKTDHSPIDYSKLARYSGEREIISGIFDRWKLPAPGAR